MSLKKAITLISLILIVDQLSKIYIKTHFQLQESVEVFTWFKIYFIENDGMAWGTKLSDIFTSISDRTAKLILTLFRLVAIVAIAHWLNTSIKHKAPKVLITAISFVLAGAIGNIIDSACYGVLFNDSYNQVATLFPEEGGYDTIFYGNVVDMLYFPIWQGILPEWLPFFGGKHFTFFEPIFNIADVAISIGFILLIVCNKKAFTR